jgi:hypothetical protein
MSVWDRSLTCRPGHLGRAARTGPSHLSPNPGRDGDRSADGAPGAPGPGENRVRPCGGCRARRRAATRRIRR